MKKERNTRKKKQQKTMRKTTRLNSVKKQKKKEGKNISVDVEIYERITDVSEMNNVDDSMILDAALRFF